MSKCCPDLIGGPVTINIKSRRWGFEFGNLTTEGDVRVKPFNNHYEDRSDGRGHMLREANTYIEGTIVFSNEFALENISRICDGVITLTGTCGNSWVMERAVFTQQNGGEINITNGTMDFRFSSKYNIVHINDYQQFGISRTIGVPVVNSLSSGVTGLTGQ